MIIEDSQCDYLQGRAAAQAALDKGAMFLIGAVCATASEGVAQVVSDVSAAGRGVFGDEGVLGVNARGALQISPGSVEAGLTLDADGEVRPQVFRVPLTDEAQGKVAAQYAREQMGAERAAVLYAAGSSYGQTLADSFTAAFGEAGGEIVATETYDPNADLFFEELEGVRDKEPDLLYLPGYAAVANLLVSQARSFGVLAPVLGSDGWDSPALDLAVMSGAVFTAHYFGDEPSGVVRTWVTRFQERFSAPPDALATLSYDAANLLFTAIAEAGVEDPALVARTLETLRFDGIAGPMSFDAVHNPIRSMIVLRVEDGQVRFVGRFGVSPDDAEE
ncbi:MAG: ABC transporter substrate-binding protein [Anaerolineae bacterium]|nr:ABC transporter substrate-binding protein [Anaerolineae bacterium]